MITNILLTLIFLILLLDFYTKNNKLKVKEYVVKKPKWSFWIHKKWVGEKVVQELEKELNI